MSNPGYQRPPHCGQGARASDTGEERLGPVGDLADRLVREFTGIRTPDLHAGGHTGRLGPPSQLPDDVVGPFDADRTQLGEHRQGGQQRSADATADVQQRAAGGRPVAVRRHRVVGHRRMAREAAMGSSPQLRATISASCSQWSRAPGEKAERMRSRAGAMSSIVSPAASRRDWGAALRTSGRGRRQARNPPGYEPPRLPGTLR